MVKGFVFGKFLPFHKGHEAMIRFALERCEHLSILVCCSNRETIPASTRKRWIEKTLQDVTGWEVLILKYDEAEFPNTSVASQEVSLKWSTVFKELLPGHSVVITSEPYGDYVAAYMNIRHIPFDMGRVQIPVSATGIRADLSGCWHFLPDAVKADLVTKVVILGSESTGKTTLTQRLSQHYHCTAVLEAARDLIPDSNAFTIADLYAVAGEHARRIRQAGISASPLVIIDTDIHITQSYSRFAFGQKLDVAGEIYAANRANLYLYLTSDVDFIQDGTRMSETGRNRLDASHRRTLAEYGIQPVEISGNWQQRFECSVQAIDQLLNLRKITKL